MYLKKTILEEHINEINYRRHYSNTLKVMIPAMDIQVPTVACIAKSVLYIIYCKLTLNLFPKFIKRHLDFDGASFALTFF